MLGRSHVHTHLQPANAPSLPHARGPSSATGKAYPLTATRFLTDFGDQALVLPVLVAVTLVLAIQRRWSLALPWVGAIVFVLAAVGLLKALAYGCGWLLPALDPDRLAVRSPSGHTASATVLYGSLAGLAALRSKALAPALTLLCAVAAGIAIGLTRVSLGAHSPMEVALGFALGLLGSVAFASVLARQRDRRVPAFALAAALLLIALQHGRHLAAEQTIQDHWSVLVRHWLPACVPH